MPEWAKAKATPKKAVATPKVSFAPGQPTTIVVGDGAVDTGQGDAGTGARQTEREDVEQLLGLLRAFVGAKEEEGPDESSSSSSSDEVNPQQSPSAT